MGILKKTTGREIPANPPSNIPCRKVISVLGTMTEFQKRRDELKQEEVDRHDQNCRIQWRVEEAPGKGRLMADMQQPSKGKKLDNSFVDRRIECLAEYTIEKEDRTPGSELWWCGALVEAVSDGSWAKIGMNGHHLKDNYKMGEAAHVLWDAVEETGKLV